MRGAEFVLGDGSFALKIANEVTRGVIKDVLLQILRDDLEVHGVIEGLLRQPPGAPDAPAKLEAAPPAPKVRVVELV